MRLQPILLLPFHRRRQRSAQRIVDDLLHRAAFAMHCVFDQPDDVVIERQGGAHTGHHDAWTNTRQDDSGSAQCAADLRSDQAELGDRAALVSQLGG